MTPGREFVSCCFPLKAVNFAFVVYKMLVPIHNPIMAFFLGLGSISDSSLVISYGPDSQQWLSAEGDLPPPVAF